MSSTLSTDEQEERVTTLMSQPIEENEEGSKQTDSDEYALEKFNTELFEKINTGARAMSVPSNFPLVNLNRYSSSFLLRKANKENGGDEQEQSEQMATSASSNKIIPAKFVTCFFGCCCRF